MAPSSLSVTLNVPEPSPESNGDVLGIDLGLVNLATDSSGETFSGHLVEKTRKRHHADAAGVCRNVARRVPNDIWGSSLAKKPGFAKTPIM